MLRAKVKAAQWNKCWVMLKDLERSKHLFKNECLVMSRFYWPDQTDEDQFPIERLSKYRPALLNEKYHAIEESFNGANSQMVLMNEPLLTTISMEITIGSCNISIKCDEIEALVLCFIQSQGTRCTVECVSQHFEGEIPSTALDQAFIFWKREGILWQKDEEYLIRESLYDKPFIDLIERESNVGSKNQSEIPDIVPFIFKILKKNQRLRQEEFIKFLKPFACCNQSILDNWVKAQLDDLVKTGWLNFHEETYSINRIKLPLLIMKGISV